MNRIASLPFVADSIILGAVSCLLGSVGLGIALLARGGHLGGDTVVDVAGVGLCASPVLALLNLVFVGRDWQAERWRAAIAGAVLSGITVFITLMSLALAD